MSAGADTPVAEDAEVDEAENGEAADAPDLFAWLSREVHELCSSHVPRIAGPPSAITFLRDHVASNRPCVVRGAFDHWPALQRWTPEYLSEVMGDAEPISSEACLRRCRACVSPYRPVSVNVTPNGRGDALLNTAGWRVEVEAASAEAAERSREQPGNGAEAETTSSPSSEKYAITTKSAATKQSVDSPEDVPSEVFVMPEERRMTFSAFFDMLGGDARREGNGGPADRPVPYVSRQNGSLLDEFPALTADCDEDLPWATEAFGGGGF